MRRRSDPTTGRALSATRSAALSALVLALGCSSSRAVPVAVPLAASASASAPATATATAPSAALAPALAAAHSVWPLPQGRWLALDKKQLQWLDTDGRALGRWKLRAKQLDVRSDGARSEVVVLDADSGRPLLLSLHAGQPAPAQPQALAVTASAPGALCLYRDAQQLLHLFALADDGLSEQWLLLQTPQGMDAQLERRLSTPLKPHGCQVDDARHTLYISEPALGVWAYRAQPEGAPQRRLLAALRGAGALALLPQGLMALVQPAGGGAAALLRLDTAGQTPPQRWQRPVAALATVRDGDRLWLRDTPDAAWRAQPLPAAWLRPAAVPAELPIVLPSGQTAPVARAGDAADDPAIWVHPQDRRRSRVLATNKKQGLLVYDLDGRELQLLPVGRINNVDLRQQLHIGAEPARDLAVATHRDEDSLVLFDIDAQGVVAELARLPVALHDLYGVCVARGPDQGLQVFANNKRGEVVQYRVERAGTQWQATPLRQFKFEGQVEGCVVDELQHTLFIGEEKRGVWAVDTDAQRPAQPRLILPVGGLMVPDVEGMAVYRGAEAAYLVVSSQGSDSFVVLDAAPPHRVRGAVRIGIAAQRGIDGVSETDGLAVSAGDFGGDYAQGILVVQDGHKRLPEGHQNFKYVGWAAIAQALGLR